MSVIAQQWGENRIVCLPENSDYITEVVYYEKEKEIYTSIESIQLMDSGRRYLWVKL